MLELEWTEGFAGQTQVLDFDCLVTETHDAPADVTDHAVENGAAITDHVRAGNDSMTIEAWATDTPITARRFGMDGATLSTQSVQLDGGATASALRLSQPIRRVKNIDEALLRLRDAGQLLTVRTRLRELTNMVIASYKVTSDSSTGAALSVSLELRKIRIATTARANAPRPAQRRQQRQENRGNQPATTPTVPDRQRYRSMLSGFLGSAAGTGSSNPFAGL